MKTIIRRPKAAAAPSFKASLLALLVAIVALGWFGPIVSAARPVTSGGFLARVVIDADPAVAGDVIRLGEIASIESEDSELQHRLETLEVGRAALPGQSRDVQVGTIRLRMRQARLPERQIAIEAANATITVHTQYQMLDADRLKGIVEEWYLAKSALPQEATLHLKVDVVPEVVPMGALTIDVAMTAPRWGQAAVPLEIRVDDRLYKRINASVEAIVEQPVWVAVRSLNRGESVTKKDVELAPKLFTQPALGPADLEHPLRTTRFVREGTVLSWDVVERIPVIVKGEHVLVVAAKGSVVVQVPGEAMSDGRVGERLAVRNLGSGNVVYGTVTEEGTVLVQVW